MSQIEKIEGAIKELYTRENDYGEACASFAEAEHNYRMAKATAFLKADGTIDQRKFIADKECSAQMKSKLTAEAVLNLTKAKLDDCRGVLFARQQILSAENRNGLAGGKWSA